MLIYDIVPPSKIIQQNQRKKKIRVLDILKPTLSLWLVVLLILQILAGVLFLPPIQEAMAADWYNSDWGYRREITVTTDESVGTPADYQVLVTLTTATMGSPSYTNVNADGSDIFFTNTNGTSPIDYWIETWDNTGDSKIWVEVPDAIDANSSKTIYMYYGYSEASSASNGTNTFEFFDDFDDGVIDTDKWTITGSPNESGGVMAVGDDFPEGVLGKTNFSYHAIRYRAYWDGSVSAGYPLVGFAQEMCSVPLEPEYPSVMICRLVGLNTYSWDTGYEGIYLGDDAWQNAYYVFEHLWKNGEAKFFAEDNLLATHTSQVPTSALPPIIGTHADHYKDAVIKVDWLFVRKYASPEPTTSVGGETALPSIQFTLTSSSGAESSTPAQLELTLSAAFDANVTVDYAVTNGTATGSGTDYTLASGTATITASNTTTAIDATFDIIDDSIDESDETIEVTISNPANASLGTNTVHTYTITDNDTAGVTVTESADSTDITEGGSTDTYDVVLTSEPTNDVVITISPDSQTTTNPTSLTFTSANWDSAQTVTVTAIDDDIAEGNHTGTITHSSASDDANYNSISISNITANITDNDTAGITVNPISGLTTTEAGGADTFTVVLDSEPTADVSISLSSSDTSEGTVSPSSLTFTSVNWSTQQTVTVTGVDDSVDDGDIGYTIVTDTASSTDSNYNNLDPDDVALTNSDDDDPASSGGGGLPPGAYNPPALPCPSSQNPQGEFKVLINNDEEYTNDRIVTLSLNGGPDAKRMAISENADFYGAGQEAYQTTRTWTLTENEEEKTIYVKFYTQYGQASQIVSDTIIYQPSFAKAMEGEEEKEELEEPEPFEPEQPEEQQPEPEEPEQEIEEPKEEVFPPLEEEPSPLEYLPKAIKEIAQKFSPIKDTFVKLKIKTQQDLERLKNIKLTIPNLKELIGLKKPELKSEITFREPVKPEIKELIPEDTLFFTACEDKIHLNTELTSLDKEEPEQEVKLISGHIIKVILKPSHSVKNVKAQFVLKEREEASYNSQNSFSDLFLSPVLAKEFENRFVLAEFELTDPDGDGIYTAEVQAPLVAGEYEIITILDYEDEEIQDKELRVITLVDPEGYVYERIKNQELRIKSAKVSLYWLNPETQKYQLWPADEYQQINPQITRETGEYSFLVPEGTYYLKVETENYLTFQSEPFEVREGEGIHKNIELEKGFWQGMDWKTISLVIILILVFILLLYNFYRDRKFRKKLLA